MKITIDTDWMLQMAAKEDGKVISTGGLVTKIGVEEKSSMGDYSGKLITFEGSEGSGKTTLASRIWWMIRGRDLSNCGIGRVEITQEPGGTLFCQRIRDLILEPEWDEPIAPKTELLLYAADRAQHVEHEIRPALETGALVVCDRYTDSTIAYQGFGRGLDLDLINRANYVATGGLLPDLTIWLDVDPEVGLERVKERGKTNRLDDEALQFHRLVHHGFSRLAELNPDRIKRVDASQDQDHVFGDTMDIINATISTWTRC